MKAKNAVIEIPELEFEIAASGKRVIDTVYNHISGAIFELTRHAAHVCCAVVVQRIAAWPRPRCCWSEVLLLFAVFEMHFYIGRFKRISNILLSCFVMPMPSHG